MSYSIFDKILILCSGIVNILALAAYTINTLADRSYIPYSEYYMNVSVRNVDINLSYFCSVSLLILLFYIIKGIYNAIKRKCNIYFFLISLVCIIPFLCVYNPFFAVYSHKIHIESDVFLWNTVHFIGIVLTITFIFKIFKSNT